MHHFVYYLHDPATYQLLYIGRSKNPRARQVQFKVREGFDTVMGPCQRFKDFERACAAEVAAIKKHAPPFNKVAHSGVGSLGIKWTEENKVKLRKPRSEQTRLRMRKPKSAEHRAAMRKPKSIEHRIKLALHLQSIGRR